MSDTWGTLTVPVRADATAQEHDAPAAVVEAPPAAPAGTGQTTAQSANLPSITRRLMILAIVAVLPALAFSAFMIVRYAQDQRVQYEQQLLATTRAMSLVIDAGISRHFAILTTLRNSRELKDRDWRAFYYLAKAAVDEPSSWVVVYDPSAQQVLSTLVPFGTDLPKSGNPDAIYRVVETRQPYISDLFVGAISKILTVAIYIPVIENDEVVNVLAFSLPAAVISKLLQSRIQLPGGVGAVFDRDNKLIARTRNEMDFVGRSAVSGYKEALQKSDEGSLEVRNLEGLLVRSVYAKSALSGWSTTLAVEEVALDAPLRRSLWIFGSVGGLFFATALLFAFCYGRSLVKSVAKLTAIAQALGRGDPLPQKRFALRETQMIADQMVHAADALSQHDHERAQLLATLTVSNERLETANQEFQGLSYSMSHVLGAPLRAINGYVQLVLDDLGDTLGSEGRRMLGMVRSSSDEMSELLEGILAFLRLGWQPLTVVAVDMRQEVCAALELMKDKTAGRKISFQIGELPSAQADASMIKRVWLNLLDNAVKFTGSKDEATIEVGARNVGDQTIYFVKDNGAGFDMQYVAKLFGVFQRLHDATQFPGTGIGLAIVNRIVVRHGGRVWAEGWPGEGATIYFRLPAAEDVHA